MASNQDTKKTRTRGHSSPAHETVITGAVASITPIDAMPPAQWDQDGDDALATALRVFFLSHTLDPLTGEVHTVH